MGVCFVGLLVSALVIGIAYVLLTQTPLVDYDETVTINEATYDEAENISIYYDVCFHNATFNVVDDPGFIIRINYKLTVLAQYCTSRKSKGPKGRIRICKFNIADMVDTYQFKF